MIKPQIVHRNNPPHLPHTDFSLSALVVCGENPFHNYQIFMELMCGKTSTKQNVNNVSLNVSFTSGKLSSVYSSFNYKNTREELIFW